jgi:hypothetical protein
VPPLVPPPHHHHHHLHLNSNLEGEASYGTIHLTSTTSIVVSQELPEEGNRVKIYGKPPIKYVYTHRNKKEKSKEKTLKSVLKAKKMDTKAKQVCFKLPRHYAHNQISVHSTPVSVEGLRWSPRLKEISELAQAPGSPHGRNQHARWSHQPTFQSLILTRYSFPSHVWLNFPL